METFDWSFNAQYIDRGQMEELATGDFIRRRDNLLFVGQSGLGKSHLMEAIGRRCCAAGYPGEVPDSIPAAQTAKTHRSRFFRAALPRFSDPEGAKVSCPAG